MIYKTIKLIITLIATLFALILAYVIYTKYIKEVPNKMNNQLQQFTESNNKSLPTILVLFSPECGPCQILSKNIYINRDSLEKVNIILASTRDSIVTHSFFDEIANSWTKDMKKTKVIYNSRDKIGSYFVEIGLPKVYIFDKNGKLEHKSDGAIHIDVIKRILKKYE